jgi:FkbM family methyltransferase
MLPIKHGRHRLLDRLSPHAWAREPSVVAVPFRNHTLHIDVSDRIGWHFLVMRDFEPAISEVLVGFANPDDSDVFWDVGANKGILSYAMAAALPDLTIVAIEPQSVMSQLLKENLETLAPFRHELFTVALGDRPGRLQELRTPGNGSLIAEKAPGNLLEQVEVVTPDTLRRRSRYGWPSLVKVDLEGFQAEVIRSLRPAFSGRRIRCCVFECPVSRFAGFHHLRRITEAYGYRLYAICKTPFSTRLAPTRDLARGATGYAIVRDDLADDRHLGWPPALQSDTSEPDDLPLVAAGRMRLRGL